MSSLESWAYLNRVVEGPSQHIQALLDVGRTADEIAGGIRERAGWIGGLKAQTEQRYTWDQPQRDLEAAAEAGFQLLTPDSTHWPAETLEVSFVRGRAVAAAEGVTIPAEAVSPHALWVRGNPDLAALTAKSVGIVGTRRSSPYGTLVTRDMVNGLAKYRYTVISGGALGIDAVAHRAALDAQVPTVVVAACGPGVDYPRQHRELFDAVVEQGGAVISEYPPGADPVRHRFLTRNRLVAALSEGLLIVEAPYRSGALNTKHWARTFNRTVMAVPGPITEQGSLGTNLAIQNEEAQMVLNADQVHEQLSSIGSVDPEGQMALQYPADPVQQLSRNELRVYDALSVAGSEGRVAEDIAADAGLTIGLTVHLLMDLQKRGIVERDRRFWGRSTLT